jgi:hypothetical protein
MLVSAARSAAETSLLRMLQDLSERSHRYRSDDQMTRELLFFWFNVFPFWDFIAKIIFGSVL